MTFSNQRITNNLSDTAIDDRTLYPAQSDLLVGLFVSLCFSVCFTLFLRSPVYLSIILFIYLCLFVYLFICLYLCVVGVGVCPLRVRSLPYLTYLSVPFLLSI